MSYYEVMSDSAQLEKQLLMFADARGLMFIQLQNTEI